MRPRIASPLTLVAAAILAFITLKLAFAGGPPPSGGGAPPPPPPPKNLQFYPKDSSRQMVVGEMFKISSALGVDCDHCHVEDHSPGGRTDFAADDKAPKNQARAMLAMTKQINDNLLASFPDRSHPPVKVECVTCHHGLPFPQTLTDRLTAAASAGGADSAVAELKGIREHSEMGQFDVSEYGISDAARNMSKTGKGKEALAILDTNAGFYPESKGIDQVKAEVHVTMGDTTGAVTILKKLVADDPNNQRAKRMLDRLTGGGK